MSLIDHLDHLVLTSVDPAATEYFYVDVLGMTLETFGEGRKAFRFGNQKINLHVRGKEFEPKAHLPVPLEQVIARLQEKGWPIIEGPVLRTGATHG